MILPPDPAPSPNEYRITSRCLSVLTGHKVMQSRWPASSQHIQDSSSDGASNNDLAPFTKSEYERGNLELDLVYRIWALDE